MSSSNNTPNFDNLLFRTLISRAPLHLQPFLNQTPEDLLLGSFDLSNDEQFNHPNKKNQLAIEEAKLEKEIIKMILSDKVDTLKANTGQTVSIGEHDFCVFYCDNSESDYKVWDWHGHITMFEEENGYIPEYIYGNYVERLPMKPPVFVAKEEDNQKNNDDKEEKVGSLEGLKELIDSGDSSTVRILHRNINAGSPRF